MDRVCPPSSEYLDPYPATTRDPRMPPHTLNYEEPVNLQPFRRRHKRVTAPTLQPKLRQQR